MKLKENVDLKVLEELGFKKWHPIEQEVTRTKYGKQIYIDLQTLEIKQRYFNCYRRPVLERYIKDLIEKGLVE